MYGSDRREGWREGDKREGGRQSTATLVVSKTNNW